jgi:hypothetical protein
VQAMRGTIACRETKPTAGTPRAGNQREHYVLAPREVRSLRRAVGLPSSIPHGSPSCSRTSGKRGWRAGKFYQSLIAECYGPTVSRSPTRTPLKFLQARRTGPVRRVFSFRKQEGSVQNAIFYFAVSALTTSIMAMYLVSLLVNFREITKGQLHPHWSASLPAPSADVPAAGREPNRST